MINNPGQCRRETGQRNAISTTGILSNMNQIISETKRSETVKSNTD